MALSHLPYSVTWNVGYGRMTWNTYESEYRARTDAMKLASLVQPAFTVDVLRRGKPVSHLSWVGFGERHPHAIDPEDLRDLPLPAEPERTRPVGTSKKFTTEDRWSEVRTAIIDRATSIIMQSDRLGDDQSAIYGAVQVLVEDPELLYRAVREAQWASLEEDVARNVKQRTLNKGVTPVARKSDVTVLDANDQPIAAPREHQNHVNGNDELEREAAKAGVEVVRKEPQVQPTCLYTGRPTNGGRFTPGADAKLKSALMRRFRYEDEDVTSPDMSPALARRFREGDLSTSEGALKEMINLGWERYATPPPVGHKKAKPKAGTEGMTTVAAAQHGNYEIRDETGTVLHTVTNDEAALDWINNNGYDLESSGDGFIIVSDAEDPDADESGEDDED